MTYVAAVGGFLLLVGVLVVAIRLLRRPTERFPGERKHLSRIESLTTWLRG